MARYIDADLLKEKLKGIIVTDDLFGMGISRGLERAETITDMMPTADVVEVKHGEWRQTEEPLGWQNVACAECSVCGESWIIDEDSSLEEFKGFWHYCLNCGAKMDGKDGAK